MFCHVSICHLKTAHLSNGSEEYLSYRRRHVFITPQQSFSAVRSRELRRYHPQRRCGESGQASPEPLSRRLRHRCRRFGRNLSSLSVSLSVLCLSFSETLCNPHHFLSLFRWIGRLDPNRIGVCCRRRPSSPPLFPEKSCEAIGPDNALSRLGWGNTPKEENPSASCRFLILLLFNCPSFGPPVLCGRMVLDASKILLNNS